MFKFFKEKIKGAVDSFTKKVEEVEEIEVEIKKEKNTESFDEEKTVLYKNSENKKHDLKKTKTENKINIKNEKINKKQPEEIKKEIKENGNKQELAEINDKKVENKKGFFEKILSKKIDEKKFENIFFDLEISLLENNVSTEVIDKIKEDLRKEIVDKPIKKGKANEIIKDTLKKTIETILKEEKIEFNKKPIIICMVGINGSGKTTTSAKLAKKFLKEGKKVVLAAADTFRAAAIDQIQEHADKLKIRLIKHQYGSDAAAVAFDAVKHAEANDLDVVIIDTAGRMHSNVNLMNEIQKVVKISKPDYVFFVGESITGNDCIEQAKKFNEITKLDGIILTKADIDEKGGTALSISYVTGKPIFYLGMGQEYNDLEEFSKEKILKNLGL